MEYVNLEPENTSDTIIVAFEKVNRNFAEVSKELDIKLKKIVFRDVEDLKPAFEDINNNFKKIDDILSKSEL